MDGDEAESDNDNNNHAPGDPVGRPHGPLGPRVVVDLKDTRNHGTSCPCLYEFACQMHNVSANGNEDAERHLLHSNDWMNSKGIAEGAK